MSMSEEEQKVFFHVLAQMKERTERSITQICGSFNDTSGELLGTGTFIECHGSTYLLTAQHVAECLFDEKIGGGRKYESGLCHSVGNAERMMYVTNPWTAWPPPHDLALSRIDPIVLQDTDRQTIGPEDFASDTKDLGEDIYFLHGFPGKQSRFTAFGPGVVSTTLPYGGCITTSQLSVFNPDIHFAITYPAEEIVDERGLSTNLPHPGGLSGSVVWKTNRVGAKGEWTPDQARIVGVARRFDQDSQCLIVTRIEYVRGFVLYALRSESAYFRWVERGRPLWDDLDDWSAAENAIPWLARMPQPINVHQPSNTQCSNPTRNSGGYARLSDDIAAFDAVCSDLSIEMPDRSPFKRNLEIVTNFITDIDADSESALKKWMQLPFDEWYWAMLSVEKLCSAVNTLRNHPDDLAKLIPLAVMEDIKQDFEPTQSKTYMYELQVAAWFQKAGFNVAFEEPDVRVSGQGLSQQIGLACKYPSSEKKLDRRISEGYEQIDRQGIAGLVVVGMDIMSCRGMKKFVQFPDRKSIILNSMANELSNWINKTIKRRAGVAGRRPLNGAIFTLSMAGIYGKPAGLIVANQMTFQSEQENPLNPDIAIIAAAIGNLSD